MVRSSIRGRDEGEEEGESTSSLRRRRAALASVRSLAAAVASFKNNPRDEALSDALDALRSKWRVACASVGAVAAAGIGVGIGGGATTLTVAVATTTFEATAEEIRGAAAAVNAAVSSSPPSASLPSLDF